MKKLYLLSIALMLLRISNGQEVLPNPGFENWTQSGSYEDPDGWTTANQFSSLIGVIMTSKAVAPDVYSGNYALKTETKFLPAPANQAIPGLVTTGDLQITTQTIDGGIPYTERPDSIAGWYRYEPVNSDTCYITFFLFSFFRDTVGRAIFSGSSTNGQYRRFSAPVEYEMPDDPYEAYFVISPSGQTGAQEGSVLYLDDMELVFATGISDHQHEIEEPELFPNIIRNRASVRNLNGKQLYLYVFNINGKAVMAEMVTREMETVEFNLPKGLYLAEFWDENKVVNRSKLIVIQ